MPSMIERSKKTRAVANLRERRVPEQQLHLIPALQALQELTVQIPKKMRGALVLFCLWPEKVGTIEMLLTEVPRPF
jgi:hypothetical protein